MSVLDYIDSEIFTPVFKNKLPLLNSPSVDRICKEIYYAIKNNEEIFVYGDYDMDGFCAQKVWSEVLSSLYSVPPVHFMYQQRMHNLDKDILVQVQESNAHIVIICDTGSSQEDRSVISLLRMRGYTPIIIDHHAWWGDYSVDSKNYLVFNSFEERDSLGGDLISGAYASLLVANKLCEVYFQHTLSYNAMVYALASMYSDVVDLSTPLGRALYNTTSIIQMPGPDFLKYMNTWNYNYSRRFFSYILSPRINSCFRTENFVPINKALLATDRYSAQSAADGIVTVHKESSRLVSMFKPLFHRERFGDVLLCSHEVVEETAMLHIRNFSGLIANAIAQEEKCCVIVVIKSNNVYQGSFRDFYDRKLLDTFRLFCKAGGHEEAFGLEFYDYKEFCRHLKLLDVIISKGARKNYTVLSSSLVKTEDDVQALALYNEYMNTRPRIFLTHRCSFLKTLVSTRYTKNYDVGLPYNISSNSPLLEGANILLEPLITRDVVLKCVE